VFCDRGTGAARFLVRADGSGRIPEEEAASLLAMHCLVRGQSPVDYIVMVDAGEELLRSVALRASNLLERGRASISPIRLSRREQEVLSGIVRNMANKEIAAMLRLSERTVKFHVTALLSKFRVHDRVSLMLEANNLLLPSDARPAPAALATPPSLAPPGANPPVAADGPPATPQPRVLRWPRRNLTF
jgi:DNA-binding CsgD family transcriptional regulator